MTTDSSPPVDVNEQVSRNVRAELARMRWTQQDLADGSARDRSWVADRLNQRAEWRISDVIRVSRAMAVPIETLLDGADNAPLPIDPQPDITPNLTEES